MKQKPDRQGGCETLHPPSRSGFRLPYLLDLYSGRSSNIVLTLAIKKRRQVIELDRPDVQMLSRMNIQATAKCHRKCRVALDTWRQQIIESGTHVRDTELSMRKRN